MKRLLVLAFAVLAGAAPQSTVPLRRHPSNPHYFEFRGRPTVLVTSGEHYGAVLNLDFDYVPYLNELQSRGFNLTRTFSGMYVESWGAPWNTLNPNPNRYAAPWARSGTPGYVDGGNRFDLNRWDDGYFARLRDFVAQAGQRGIAVEMVLYCVMYGDGEWILSPLHPNNNVNGVGAGVPRDQVFTLSNGGITAAQDALTAKIVRELNAYDNVYFELCNEPYASNVTQAWHQHTADVVTQTESGLPNKHLIAHNINNGSGAVGNPISSVGVLNFHYASPPDAVAQNFGLGRVIAFDETGFRGGGDDPYRKEAWEFLIAGGAVYSNLDWSYTEASENGASSNWDHNLGPGGPGIRGQLSILKRFMDTFDLLPMGPNNAVIAGGVPSGAQARALVQSGEQYAVFVNGGSQANLILNLPAGTYRAEWVNTRTGAVDRAEDLSHPGGNRTLSSPGYTQDIALRVKKSGAAPPPTGNATFYRAINLNGPALTIDGQGWEGSNAPNFSYSGSAFANQSVSLNPGTDAARATMIRSSIWNPAGSNVTLSNVPNGRYQVYLYVWEDNFSVGYSISLEGQVVQSGYNSGSGGHWDRLGPWTTDINDGSINITCSAGDANLSGIEVWSLSGATPPPPPSGGARVVMPLGDSLTYGFVSPNSPNNEDGGFRRFLWERLASSGRTGLNFVGSLQNGLGSIDRDHEGHPGWRTDELAANVTGWLNATAPELILLIAGTNDLNQGRSPADALTQYGILLDRALAARPSATLLVSTTLIPRVNNDYPQVTAAKVSSFNAGVPGLVSSRASQGKRIAFVDVASRAALNTASGSADFGADGLHPSPAGYQKMANAWYDAATPYLAAPSAPPPPPPSGGGTFYRAINLNGPALTIDGRAWAGSNAPNYSYSGSAFENQNVALNPATDAARATMLRSSIWNPSGSNVTLNSVPNGSYQVYLYVWEDNFSVTYNLSVQGQVVRSGYSSGAGGHWDKLGPWTANVTDGSLRVTCSAGDANLSGIEVWSLSAAPPPPPANGLVAHWKMDETGGGTASDASGNGNAAALSPDGPVWTSGRVGGGLDFNGAGDLLSAPSSPSLNSLKSGMTVALWVYKRSDAPTWGGFAGRRRGAQWEDLWVLFCNNSAGDEYQFALTTSSGTVTVPGPSSVGDRNTWVHLAGVYDGGNLILYRNGQEIGRRAQSGTIADESSPVVIGGGDNGNTGFGEYVNAVIDDVRLYNRALTPAELQALAAP